MSGRTTKTLIIQAPDGTDIATSTSGDYDIAGIVEVFEGGWALAARGDSWPSVEKRTRSRMRRDSARSMHVSLLWEETAGTIRRYFGTHAVRIDMVFTPSSGWEQRNLYAGASVLRKLRKEGITGVHVVKHNPKEHDFRRQADFQMDELFNVRGHLIRAS